MADETKAGAIAALERVPTLKVHAISYDEEQRSNAVSEEDKKVLGIFTEAGCLPPPYAPRELARIIENSNCLPQNIQAYATNIDGFGHRFVPVIDLNADDADAKIADAIFMERLAAAEDTPSPDDENAIPEATPEEVAARKALIAVEMRKEKARLESFFEFCCQDYSFITCRQRTRTDKEGIGYGFWEMIRNGLGQVVEIKHVPAPTMQLLPAGPWEDAVARVRVSILSYKDMPKRRRFRRYMQSVEGLTTYFKEFGDKRLMSAKSGRFYRTPEAMKADEPGARPATEILEFKIYSPLGAYGVPRWVGNLLSVLGSRQSEYVNYLYFDNKSVPPLAVMVEGGRLGAESVSQLKDYVKNAIRGADNFHKILVIEAAPAENAPSSPGADGKVRIKIQSLSDALTKDGLFMEYDRRNRDKVGESFRLPKLLRGDSSDVNRATADAALAFAEQQVFAGERAEFDFTINRKLLADLNAKYHRFESLGPDLSDQASIADAVVKLSNALTIGEQREIAADVFNREFRKIDAPWTEKPAPLVLAEMQANAGLGTMGDGLDVPPPVKTTSTAASADGAPELVPIDAEVLASEAVRLVKLHKAFLSAEADLAARDFSEAREEVVVKISPEEMAKLVTTGA